MKMIRKLVVLGLVMSVCLLSFSGIGSAHSLWINATEYSPEFSSDSGAKSRIYMGWGHHFPVDGTIRPEVLAELALIGPNGKKQQITPEDNGFLATELSFQQQGIYTVSVTKKPSFYTTYLEGGKVLRQSVPKTGLQNIVSSLYTESFSKCLINVGDAQDKAVVKPVGHKLEIVPLENPYKFGGVGQMLPVKVLLDGKPVECTIFASYGSFSSGADYAFATSTSSKGIAYIRISHWGPWLIKTNVKLPAPDELKEKCNEVSYTATLTFQIP